MAEPIRLQKYIADCGVCSRRRAEVLISEGKVTVNGAAAHIGDKVDPEKDDVKVGIQKISSSHKKYVYVLLNKPRGYITTLNDELGRKCVTELLTEVNERVVPIGRLDRDSEGMLLLTNDGDLVYKLTHPKHEVPKYYVCVVAGEVGGDKLERLNRPMEIDGYLVEGTEVSVLKKKPDRTMLRFVLKEGRNRQIRKMCENAGLEVLRLKRVAVGELRLAEVKSGKWRYLNEDEIDYLKSL
jgi:23S rRNA pseudouridine2605 synthase